MPIKNLRFYLLLSTAVILLFVGIVVGLWRLIVSGPAGISQKEIEQILAMESPVFASDGVSKIGVFFEESHRQYIPYEKIPKFFLHAAVAAEDRNFFHHHGVDFSGIFRAMLVNLKEGRVVQGGSTITQQTAKNLFKRKDRSFAAKLKEMINAIRLEHYFTKEKILEFYCNQFYVSGNGHGLGVAARYYFDKDPAELDLVESAFIAGSLKRPNYYNPFSKKTEAEANLARQRAKSRTLYVLEQMLEAGMISSASFKRESTRDIPFQLGKMFFATNVLLDVLKDLLETPDFVEILSSHGIDNIATSGIRVHSTIDAGLQDQALQQLRQQFSRLDVRMQGYQREAVQQQYAQIPEQAVWDIKEGTFLFGRITNVQRGANPSINISFDRKRISGIIDMAGLMPILNSHIKWQQHRWLDVSPKDLPRLLEQLQTGDKVYVRVRTIHPLAGLICDLEKYPSLQGAAMVLQQGRIRAMIGGVENHFYNRAVYARRSMGSLFKPVVYTAAIQLGWSPLDMLQNERKVFVYQRRPYFPRPDHVSPYGEVSMSWAGAHSENIATVWLLAHLCDKLTAAQLTDMVNRLDLSRRATESYEQYAARIRDSIGVLVNESSLRQSAFEKAVKSVEPDLLFEGNPEELSVLRSLSFGADFPLFRQQIDARMKEEQDKEKLKDLQTQRFLLSRSFLDFAAVKNSLARLRTNTEASAFTGADASAPAMQTRFYRKNDAKDVLAFSDVPLAAGIWTEIPAEIALQRPDGSDDSGFWENILVRGRLRVATIVLVEQQLAKEFDRLAVLPPYSPEVLMETKDFRIAAGLHYLLQLARALGIDSPLEPVLSFPLGSNVITLLESARAYETMVLGSRFTPLLPGREESVAVHPGLFLLERIENSDGETIFQNRRVSTAVVDDKTSESLRDILRNVIMIGTGNYARTHVRMGSAIKATDERLKKLDLALPLFGKTGTANDYTNAAFAGYLPGVQAGIQGLTMQNGYTIACYAGYDDNQPMKRASTHLTGAAAALPLWTDLVNTLVREKKYSDSIDLADQAFQGGREIVLRQTASGAIRIPVEAGAGGRPLSRDSGTSSAAGITAHVNVAESGEIHPVRWYTPFWLNAANQQNTKQAQQ